ncbi:hypothetical protein DFH07DRAFT_1060067 [Mycena maculata]|uniref:Uncharacterized protein n=1 Tax=Mycena maculata TaxID=230809 RepID=A0AAD7NGN5_9AGAR|nr:hypothetical protein DFH07DRAFT_1060067 [Mycena maculata]
MPIPREIDILIPTPPSHCRWPSKRRLELRRQRAEFLEQLARLDLRETLTDWYPEAPVPARDTLARTPRRCHVIGRDLPRFLSPTRHTPVFRHLPPSAFHSQFHTQASPAGDFSSLRPHSILALLPSSRICPVMPLNTHPPFASPMRDRQSPAPRVIRPPAICREHEMRGPHALYVAGVAPAPDDHPPHLLSSLSLRLLCSVCATVTCLTSFPPVLHPPASATAR